MEKKQKRRGVPEKKYTYDIIRTVRPDRDDCAKEDMSIEFFMTGTTDGPTEMTMLEDELCSGLKTYATGPNGFSYKDGDKIITYTLVMRPSVEIREHDRELLKDFAEYLREKKSRAVGSDVVSDAADAVAADVVEAIG